MPETDPSEPPGLNGKLVLVILLISSVATVALGLAIIRPGEDFEPVPAAQRPFGPATYEERDDAPLLDKGRAAAAAKSQQGTDE